MPKKLNIYRSRQGNRALFHLVRAFSKQWLSYKTDIPLHRLYNYAKGGNLTVEDVEKIRDVISDINDLNEQLTES